MMLWVECALYCRSVDALAASPRLEAKALVSSSNTLAQALVCTEYGVRTNKIDANEMQFPNIIRLSMDPRCSYLTKGARNYAWTIVVDARHGILSLV